MARLHGKSGSITWAAGYSQHCFSWSADRAEAQADGTTFGMVNEVSDGGLKNGSGSFQCYVDDTTPLTEPGSTGTAVFKMSGSRTLTAKIRITDFSVQVNLTGNEVVTYSWVLSGDGSASDWVIA